MLPATSHERTKHTAIVGAMMPPSSAQLTALSAARAHGHERRMIGGAREVRSFRVQLQVFPPFLPPQPVRGLNGFGGGADDVDVTVKRVLHCHDMREVHNGYTRLDGVSNKPVVITAGASEQEERTRRHDSTWRQRALTRRGRWRTEAQLQGKRRASTQNSRCPTGCRGTRCRCARRWCGGRRPGREDGTRKRQTGRS